MRDNMSNKLTNLINKGYEQYHDQQFNQAMHSWHQAYEELKTQLKDNPISFLQLGNTFGFQIKIGNWLKQLGALYLSLSDYDKAIDYCQDVITLFKDDKYIIDFYIMMGQALFAKNMPDKANQHFKELLKRYPNDLNIIEAYLQCLKSHDLSKCKEIITSFVPLTLEYTSESESLFHLCKEILASLGDHDLAKKYGTVQKIQNDFGKRKPITKKIKIGRNDPCPCGSGKKYKNCCGRK